MTQIYGANLFDAEVCFITFWALQNPDFLGIAESGVTG